MRALFFLLSFISFSAFAAPGKSIVEYGMLNSLKNVENVEVLELNRRWIFLLSCTLYPIVCLDGMREYTIDVKLTTTEFGDLDYTCDLYHYYRKHYLNVVICLPQGHGHAFKQFMKKDSASITMAD